MNRELSTARLYALRFFFLFNAVVIAFGSWPQLIHPETPFDLLHSVAYSLYAGYSILMLAGVRLPIRILPLLLLQIIYKTIWLVLVGLPMWGAGHFDEVSLTVKFFGFVVLLDVAFIPWGYVFRNNVRVVVPGEGSTGSL